MDLDPCLALVERVKNAASWSLGARMIVRPMIRFGLHAATPVERIGPAVRREIDHLIRHAETELVDLPEARAALDRGKEQGRFPRQELQAIAVGNGAREKVSAWIRKHERFEHRLTWLLDPSVTARELDRLDPLVDHDQIWNYVRFTFRPELLYGVWGNTMERIAQFEATATFFHATGKAEGISLKRTEDTALFYAYLHNWGKDGYHGQKALEGMNRIHGRYAVHNDGLKYVLLNGCFTVLDGLDVISHRPLSEKEKRGYFHATIEMGKGMNIQELNHSWDDMEGWFRTLNQSSAAYSPYKVRAWTAIEDQFDIDLNVPRVLSRFRRLAEVVAMDETYRSALGFEKPSDGKARFVKRVMRTVAKLRSWLPSEPYIQSLQTYASYPNGVDVENVGEKERSERMPSACPFARSGAPKPNKGYPENQKPLLGPEYAAPIRDQPTFTWDEVKKHNREDDLWVVWGGHVYDVSSFANQHPGGLAVLLNGVGKDMTRAFEKAKHSHITKIFTLNFRIGIIEGPPTRSVVEGGADVQDDSQQREHR